MAGLIKAQAGSLVAALALCALPIGGRQTQRIPGLGAVRLAGGRDGLSVTATSFDGTITTWLVEAEADGEVALRLEWLAELARHFPADAEIAIAADDRAATVTSGRSRFKLPVFPIADLLEPLLLGEETGRLELDAKIAGDLFARPAFAASTDESRFYLKSIFLHNTGDDLVAIAADAFRFCRIAARGTTVLSTDRTLIIPSEMVKTIDRLLGSVSGNVTLRRSERLFSVEGTGFVLVTKRIDATYPDYERLISSEAPNVVTTSRARLRESLARFAAVADPQTRAHLVTLRWNAGWLHLSAPDGSEDCLAADVEGEAETAVQVRYLAELTDALRGDGIRLNAGEQGSMILVTDPEDENFFAGLMPIRRRPS